MGEYTGVEYSGGNFPGGSVPRTYFYSGRYTIHLKDSLVFTSRKMDFHTEIKTECVLDVYIIYIYIHRVKKLE